MYLDGFSLARSPGAVDAFLTALQHRVTGRARAEVEQLMAFAKGLSWDIELSQWHLSGLQPQSLAACLRKEQLDHVDQTVLCCVASNLLRFPVLFAHHLIWVQSLSANRSCMSSWHLKMSAFPKDTP